MDRRRSGDGEVIVCVTIIFHCHRTAEYECRMREHWQSSQNLSPEDLKEWEVRRTEIRRGKSFSWEPKGLQEMSCMFNA